MLAPLLLRRVMRDVFPPVDKVPKSSEVEEGRLSEQDKSIAEAMMKSPIRFMMSSWLS